MSRAGTLLFVLLLGACGAQHVKVEPITVKPIHVTVDVNLRDAAIGSADKK